MPSGFYPASLAADWQTCGRFGDLAAAEVISFRGTAHHTSAGFYPRKTAPAATRVIRIIAHEYS